jgi:hypothetical protein
VVAFLLPLLRLLKLHLPLPLSLPPLLPLLHPQFQWLHQRQRLWLRMSLSLRLWLNTLAPIRRHLGHII